MRGMLDTGTETSCFTLVKYASEIVSRIDHNALACPLSLAAI